MGTSSGTSELATTQLTTHGTQLSAREGPRTASPRFRGNVSRWYAPSAEFPGQIASELPATFLGFCIAEASHGLMGNLYMSGGPLPGWEFHRLHTGQSWAFLWYHGDRGGYLLVVASW